jgi:PAS domain S-box-containing protein
MKRLFPPAALLPQLGTALAYLVVGWLSLALAAGPTTAAPLYPPAGIALACVLAFGLRVLPAVALGSFGANVLLALERSGGSLPGAAMTASLLMVGLGAAAQAGVGAWLVRRALKDRLDLNEGADVARFYCLGGPLACLVSASVSTLALWRAGLVPAGDIGSHWFTWWAGDTLGVLIGAPIAMTLIGRPRASWAHRRVTVGLSLAVVTALLASAGHQVTRWDRQRTWVIFERDATRSADALVAQLQNPLHALHAVRAAVALDPARRSEALRSASAYWLGQPLHLQAIGWAQEVPRTRLPMFEQAVREEIGLRSYQVFDRRDAQAVPQATQDPMVVAIRHIEPRAGNLGALGVNVLSIASARPAVEATRRHRLPAASGGFRLTQETGDQTGVVIYQALNAGPAAGGDNGVLFVTLRMEDAVRSVAAALPGYLQWCLVDTAPAGGRVRLAGRPGCESAAAPGFQLVRPISFAGRHWDLRVEAEGGTVPDNRHWNAWVFSVVGLMSTAMLGAMLLTMTGRTRRIEEAVAERTADLQREVAERSRTEAALRESEQRFRNILDHLPVGLVYTDTEASIKEVNPHLQQLLGYRPDELLGRSKLDITHPEDRAGDIELCGRLLAGEMPMYRRHERLVAKDGRVVSVQVTVSALNDAQGRPRRLVCLVEDITEHLRLQDAERARQAAEAASHAKSEFVSRMSHELRTPLNAMLGFAQLLELDGQRPLAQHQRDWTSQIQQAGWHLLHMINDTLDLSRIESGTMRLELKALPLQEVMAAARTLVEQSAQRRRVSIEQSLGREAPLVLADDTRLKQVLINLLSNAIKYNVEGGRIWITSRAVDDGMVEVLVRDSGLGMAPEQLAELFQPFNRLGRDAYGEGTGIGLVISRRLAELMGGTLDAQSTEGAGSTFRLRIPAAHAHGATVPETDDAAPAEASYRQRVVHSVEDNETNAEVMRGVLAQRPQVRLRVSTSGLDGLAAIRRAPPSLVLLDMHLPDVDGLELLRHLKADATVRQVPVVVVSADATRERIDQAMALGASHYVTKPVNVAHMLALLDEVLEEQETHFGTLL